MNDIATVLDKELDIELDDKNPIIIKDDRYTNVKNQILKFAIDAAKEQNLSEKEIEFLLKMIHDVYLDKKAKFYFETKINTMNKIMSNLSKCISNPTKLEDSTHLYYYYHTKHNLKNEW